MLGSEMDSFRTSKGMGPVHVEWNEDILISKAVEWNEDISATKAVEWNGDISATKVVEWYRDTNLLYVVRGLFSA